MPRVAQKRDLLGHANVDVNNISCNVNMEGLFFAFPLKEDEGDNPGKVTLQSGFLYFFYFFYLTRITKKSCNGGDSGSNGLV